MLTAPPREAPWVSSLLAGLWALAIFTVVPFARPWRELVIERWGRPLFGYLTLLAIVIAVGVTVRYLARQKATASYVWLALITAVLIGYTLYLWREPEEALHFVQYGVFGVLCYRALCHRIRDVSVYFTAMLIGVTVGLVDEFLQWLTPNRYWDLRDVWIDLLGVALAQLAIAKGLRPTIIQGLPDAGSFRVFCRTGLVLLAVLTLTLLNTPPRIAWLAQRVPFLAYLETNDSVMLEYGHRTIDRQAGPFRSRMTLDELRRIDRQRGAAVAMILDQFKDPQHYSIFLRRFTPITDPFTHEVRVHLFRRDSHLEWALDPDIGEDQRRVHYTVAWREHRLLERYFSNTLRLSSYGLSAERVEFLERQLLPEHELPTREVESTVSRHLVIWVNEGQILFVVSLLALALVGLGRCYGPARFVDDEA